MTNMSGQFITTSADVTLNGGLIRELPQNPLNSGLGIILICPVQFNHREYQLSSTLLLTTPVKPTILLPETPYYLEGVGFFGRAATSGSSLVG